MEILELLGAALGIGALAGISLYLTVGTIGFVVFMDWIILRPELEPLQILENPWVWGIALGLYAIEFFADKIPWVDSLWDAVHTFIRPIGIMCVAATTLGQANPSLMIIGVLLVGSAAIASHITKAGTRLMLNTSPEPVTNVAASFIGDGLVIGGSFLVLQNPVLALILILLAVIFFIYFVPLLLRSIRALLSYVFHRWTWPGANKDYTSLPNHLHYDYHIALARKMGQDVEIEWAVPCITGRLGWTGKNVIGWVAKVKGEHGLFFVGRRCLRTVARRFLTEDTIVNRNECLLYDEVTFYKPQKGVTASLRFYKRDGNLSKMIKDIYAEQSSQVEAAAGLTPSPA